MWFLDPLPLALAASPFPPPLPGLKGLTAGLGALSFQTKRSDNLIHFSGFIHAFIYSTNIY